MKTNELIPWLEGRHEYYCDKVAAFFEFTDHLYKFNRPSIEFKAKAMRIAGQAYTQTAYPKCSYNLVYLVSMGGQYEQTIAHEVVHHAVNQFDMNSAVHGDLFKFILNKICGRRPAKYHEYTYNDTHVMLAQLLMAVLEK